MTYVLEIDSKGDIHLPEAVRNAHGLYAGGRLRLETEMEPFEELRLIPEHEDVSLKRKNGLLVVDGPSPAVLRMENGFPRIDGLPPEPIEDTVAAIKRMRRERMAHISGPPYLPDDFV